MDRDTIFALSSGNPPAAIAVVRISGPDANDAMERLAGTLPEARRAVMASLRVPESREVIDNALIIRFAAPASATGEDVAELHLHGGRAVVAAVLNALSKMEGLRPAEPGQFTRRAFENGRIDLAEAEGLADLLEAETQSQRRAALALAGGALSRAVEAWQQQTLALAARLEAALDFSDEGEVGEQLPDGWTEDLAKLIADLEAALARPPAERLKEGVRVAIAGPPNAGKSSLLNVLAGREAAITSPVPGTTRDLVEAPTALGGMPFLLVDTAGLRETADPVESIGIDRANRTLAAADLILWLGKPADCPDLDRSIVVRPKADLQGTGDHYDADVSVSSVTGSGIERLLELLSARAAQLLPAEGEAALNGRHREALGSALAAFRSAASSADFVVAAEWLRRALGAFDSVTGRAGVEDMLDALFGRFCVGK